jgi:hypothetical protein
MTGAEINSKLERGVLGRGAIRQLRGEFYQLQAPSDSTFSQGVVDSVTRQATGIDAAWDAKDNALTLRISFGGPGLWIPYLGNGVKSKLVGVAQTLNHGLGTYTPPLVSGGAISWVVTGPFSGCTAATFSPTGAKVFAHIITPGGGRTCDAVPNQIANIATQVNAPEPKDHALFTPNGPGVGYVFWTYLSGGWYRRVLWGGQGMGFVPVLGVERKEPV